MMSLTPQTLSSPAETAMMMITRKHRRTLGRHFNVQLSSKCMGNKDWTLEHRQRELQIQTLELVTGVEHEVLLVDVVASDWRIEFEQQ